MSNTIETRLKLVEGYRSMVTFDLEGVQEMVVDEPKPIGEGSGPSSTRLLSAAVGHCLGSSLIYCLRRAKIEIKGMETIVSLSTFRNPEGRLRVKNIDVQIALDVDEEAKTRLARCLDIFENYCTVTGSIRKGIEVNVKVVQP